MKYGLLVLLLLEAAGGLSIMTWREYFWESVSKLDYNKFVYYIIIFTAIALILCVVSALINYWTAILGLRERKHLTKVAITKDYNNIEGGAQRVQEDCYRYPVIRNFLVVGLIQTLLSMCVAIYIVLSQLAWYYVLIPIAYSAIMSLIGAKIAHPLIGLNYLKQKTEAAFRFNVCRENFKEANSTQYKVAKARKKLSYFQGFYNQITVIIPFIVLAPDYFGHIIAFGALMQLSSALAELINSASYFINSFADINDWLSCRKRLKELEILK